MQKMTLFPMVLAAALLLSACGGGQQAEIPDVPYEPVEYRLYPAPEDAYVGDTMPFVADGELELYYLYDTDHNGQGYHPIYKYSTTDFTSYTNHGKMLDFGTMAEPDPAIGTGSVLQDHEGLYHLFYTGHSDVGSGPNKDRECVMHATSTDRESWVKIPEDTFYCAENYSGEDFRDPEVFWNEEEQCWWLLIAAREKTQGGVVARYTSDDLKNWTLCDPLFAPHDQYMLECPDLFQMGDKWYLTYSWDCVTYYAVSDSMYGPFTVPKDNVLDGNNFIFYAAKTAEFNGNRYLCGWLGRAALSDDSGKYGWAGNVLNHQLLQKPDGSLGVREPESFAGYFTQPLAYKATPKEGKVKIGKEGYIALSAADGTLALADLGMRYPTVMLECDVAMGDTGRVGFAFGGVDGEPYTALCLDANENKMHYEGTEVTELDRWDAEAFTRFDFSQSDTHHVKLICENEIVVMYVDDTKALSSRIKRSIDGAHIALFADGADARFSNIAMKLPE